MTQFTKDSHSPTATTYKVVKRVPTWRKRSPSALDVIDVALRARGNELTWALRRLARRVSLLTRRRRR